MELRVNCPRCRDNHKHLGINYTKKVFGCVRCGYSGTLYEWEKEHGKCNGQVSKPPQGQYVDYPQDALQDLWTRRDHPGFKYLISRQVPPGDIYTYRFATSPSQYLLGRVIIPFKDQNYYVARDYTGLQAPKYLNPPQEQGYKGRSEVIFNLDRVTPGGTVVITEGVFDAIWISRTGVPAVAMLGKMVTKQQVSMILDRGPGFTVVWLDRDAQDEADQLGRVLSRKGIQVKVIDWEKEIPPGYKEPDGIPYDLAVPVMSHCPTKCG